MLSLDKRRPTTKELPIKLSKTNVVAIMNVFLRFQWLKLNKSRVFFQSNVPRLWLDLFGEEPIQKIVRSFSNV